MKVRYKVMVTITIIAIVSSVLYGDLWETFTTENSDLPSNEITATAIDRDGNKWFGTNSGLARLRNDQWTVYKTDNSDIPSNIIRAITVHPQTGNIWLGTNNGLARFTGNTWTVYNMANSDLPRNVVTSVAVDGFGSIWAGTLNGGVARLTGNNWVVYTRTNSPLPHMNVRALAATEDRTVWIGTDNGLASFYGGQWEVFNTGNSALRDDNITSIAVFNDNDKAIGTSMGGVMLIVDGISMAFHVGNSSLPSNSISAIAAKNNGIMWIGTAYNGIVKFNNLRMTVYDSFNSDLVDDAIKSIAIDLEMKKWIGTNNGVVSYNEITVAGIIVSPDTLVVDAGEGSQLEATIIPANATNKNHSWFSSDDEVATVNDTGYVSAHVPGTAVVRAVTADGQRVSTSFVIVPGVVEMPEFDPPAGNYDDPIFVTLSSDTEDAIIYYTTDESEPTEESLRYTESIRIDAPTIIKAIAYREYWEQSEVATAFYNVATAVEDDYAQMPVSSQSFAFPNPIGLTDTEINRTDITISFNARANEKVEISIYDIRGRKILDAVHSTINDGENRYSFSVTNVDGKSLAPGIYFYTVNRPEAVIKGKFSIIR